MEMKATTLYYLTEIAGFFGKVPFLKRVLRTPYDNFMRIVSGEYSRKKNFDAHGLEALRIFDECLTKHNFDYSLAYGSCLGAVREKGFIKHDDDIDVWMWYDDYKPELIDILKESGFKLVYSFSLENDREGKEETYEYKGVQIDVFYLYPENDKAYSCIFNSVPGCKGRMDSVKKYGGLIPTKCILPISRSNVRVPFLGLSLPIPENANELLACRYGKDYMIPQPKWSKDREDNYHVIIRDKLAAYKEF